MSQPSRTLPQSKETLLKSYTKRLKDDVKSILDNFTEILKCSKIRSRAALNAHHREVFAVRRFTALAVKQVEDETQVSRVTQVTQDQYESNVRASNIVRAGESLMKLVSDIKEFLILNDFPSVNKSITDRTARLTAIQQQSNKQLMTLKEDMAVTLYALEEAYYSSQHH